MKWKAAVCFLKGGPLKGILNIGFKENDYGSTQDW